MTEQSWDDLGVVCHACTAVKGTEVAYHFAHHALEDADIAALEPFELGETTTEPKPPERT